MRIQTAIEPLTTLTSFNNVPNGSLTLLNDVIEGFSTRKSRPNMLLICCLSRSRLQTTVFRTWKNWLMMHWALSLQVQIPRPTVQATYYMLTHRDVLKRLQDELQRTLRENGGQLEWASIQQLPYLVSCSSRRAIIFRTKKYRALLFKNTALINPCSWATLPGGSASGSSVRVASSPWPGELQKQLSCFRAEA